MTNAELLAQLQANERQIKHLNGQVAMLCDQLTIANEQIEALKHWRFGHRTERIDDPGQQVLAEIAEAFGTGTAAAPLVEDDLIAEVPAKHSGKQKKQGKRRLPSEMFPDARVEEVVIGLSDEELSMQDGTSMVILGRETKEEIVYDPATMYIRRTIRLQYGISVTAEKILIAPPAPCIITRGLLSDETILQIVIHHTIDCLPFNRIAEMMGRSGFDVGRQLITSSFHGFCTLAKPLMEVIKAELLKAELLHIDGSFLFRQDRKKKRRCQRSPIYVISDGNQMLFNWRPDEKHETASDLITGYSGYLIRDEWDGWYKLDTDVLVYVGCNAHARRYFAQNQKDEDCAKMVALYALLYAVEAEAGESGLQGQALFDHRYALRQERSVQIMDAIEAHAADMAARRTSKAKTAANYIIKHRSELRRFLDIGALPPDNNLAERALRRNAMLRNNRRFFVAADGGENLAIAMSLTLSCRLLDLDPFLYLQAILPPLFAYRDAQRRGSTELPDLRPYTPAAIARRLETKRTEVQADKTGPTE